MNSLFKRNQQTINEKNLQIAMRSSLLAGSIVCLLFFASFFVKSIENKRFLYFIFLMLFFVLFGIMRKFTHRKSHYVYILFYAFILFTYLFAIELGTAYSPSTNATTFCVLLLALPLLIVDIPFRTDILLTVVTIIFCIKSYAFKEPHIFSLDLVNSISFLILSIFVNYYITKTQLNDIENQKIIKWERDRDSLTQIFNRNAAIEMIDEYIKTTSSPGCLMVADIDNFKSVNDTYGHKSGDEAIRLFTTSITSTIRSNDIIGRFGGDEFLIFFRNVPSRDACEKKAEIILETFRLSAVGRPYENSITASLGIAFYPNEAACYNDLFEIADKALYKAKEKGKNQYYCNSITF